MIVGGNTVIGYAPWFTTMDYDGIAAEVIFHGSQNSEIIPFQAARAFFGELPDDLELAGVGLHIYNAWRRSRRSRRS